MDNKSNITESKNTSDNSDAKIPSGGDKGRNLLKTMGFKILGLKDSNAQDAFNSNKEGKQNQENAQVNPASHKTDAGEKSVYIYNKNDQMLLDLANDITELFKRV